MRTGRSRCASPLEGVPDGAEIRLPSGVSGTVVDLGGGRWQVTTDGGKLDAVGAGDQRRQRRHGDQR